MFKKLFIFVSLLFTASFLLIGCGQTTTTSEDLNWYWN